MINCKCLRVTRVHGRICVVKVLCHWGPIYIVSTAKEHAKLHCARTFWPENIEATRIVFLSASPFVNSGHVGGNTKKTNCENMVDEHVTVGQFNPVVHLR